MSNQNNNNQQQGQKQPRRQYNFTPVLPMRAKYNVSEWAIREKEYSDSIDSIVFPFDPDDVDITNLNAMIDQCYSIAKIEQAIYTRLYEKMHLKRKNSEIEAYLIVKRTQPKDANGNAPKITEGEMKALVVEYLGHTPVDTTQFTIYQLEEMAQDRRIYMDAILDILRQKSDKLITNSGALKLGVQLMNFGGGNQP